jgi:hypothetical protein
MQKLGKVANSGFSCEELQEIGWKLARTGIRSEYIDLAADSKLPEAGLLVIRAGADSLVETNYRNPRAASDRLYSEQWALPMDKKALMRGRVVNKLARWNLCFDETAQAPDYERGFGTVIAFQEVPELEQIRAHLPQWFGSKAENLKMEANYYYNIKKCGIGFHGDTERRIVIGLRLGAQIPLRFQWFLRSSPVFDPIDIVLEHGDLYCMSDKAVGHDWKKRTIYTLRHSAGASKYTSTPAQK